MNSPSTCNPPCIHTFPEGSPQAAQFPDGVYVQASGFPDFTPYSEVNVQIEMTGRNTTDFARAEAEAQRLGVELPDDYRETYTWHHHEDGETMQLVPKDLNNPGPRGGVPHSGGAMVTGSQRPSTGSVTIEGD